MNATKCGSNGFASGNEQRLQQLTVDTGGLMQILQCGRRTAVDIGNAAEARVEIGRRLLWNVEKVQHYINKISE